MNIAEILRGLADKIDGINGGGEEAHQSQSAQLQPAEVSNDENPDINTTEYLEKRIKELTEQLETLSKAQRERTVKEVLEKKGVNLKAARLVLKDLDDVNEDSVSNWLDDNADLFGIKVQEETPRVDATNLAALRQQDIVTQGAITPDRNADLSMRLDSAESAEDILSLLRSQE